jgi:hypothetical protein
MAVGGEVGMFAPSENLEGSLIVSGFYEYYVSPRVSLRPSVTFLSPGLDREPTDGLRQTRYGFDVLYNWERGKWHPFVGGGVAAHALQLKDNGHGIGDSVAELGVAGLGGVELFLDRRNALKFEGRAQFVGNAFGFDPGGFALTVGYKRYF